MKLDWVDSQGRKGCVAFDGGDDKLASVVLVDGADPAHHTYDVAGLRGVIAALQQVEQALRGEPTVKIERWLIPLDIAQHGDLWVWHSAAWTHTGCYEFTARETTRGVVLMRRGANYYESGFDSGDYFIPVRDTQ